MCVWWPRPQQQHHSMLEFNNTGVRRGHTACTYTYVHIMCWPSVCLPLSLLCSIKSESVRTICIITPKVYVRAPPATFCSMNTSEPWKVFQPTDCTKVKCDATQMSCHHTMRHSGLCGRVQLQHLQLKKALLLLPCHVALFGFVSIISQQEESKKQ